MHLADEESAPSKRIYSFEGHRPAGLSVTAAAALRVSRPALSGLLNAKADLSGDMALRIGEAFGVRMDTLMRMQAAYDIAQTRKREKTDPRPATSSDGQHSCLIAGAVR